MPIHLSVTQADDPGLDLFPELQTLSAKHPPEQIYIKMTQHPRSLSLQPACSPSTASSQPFELDNLE